MSREILVQVRENNKQVAITEKGVLDDFFMEVERHQAILGNIYKGRVESILPSINGAFVNIGQERNGFLYLTDAVNPLMEEELPSPRNFLNKVFNKKPQSKSRRTQSNHGNLKPGQEILVQVVKEPFGNKGARLTSHITLAGRCVVYMPYDKHFGISRRIENVEERKRLKEVFHSFPINKSGGIIIRTASHKQDKRELIRDAKYLMKIWQQVLKVSEPKKAPALIYKELELVWKVARDYLTNDIDRLVIDSYEEYQKLRKIVANLIGRQMINKIHYHKGTGGTTLFEAKNVSKQLEKIFHSRVYLKSGAYVVIEPTEGLIVVDVNSGKFRTKASPEDAAFQVNLEAAPEIARQLRLRDLGGIIVIDFIDMVKESHKRKVLHALQDGFARDHSKTEVNRISHLGLVEMTRARAGKTIEAISFGECPYCEGRGKVKID